MLTKTELQVHPQFWWPGLSLRQKIAHLAGFELEPRNETSPRPLHAFSRPQSLNNSIVMLDFVCLLYKALSDKTSP